MGRRKVFGDWKGIGRGKEPVSRKSATVMLNRKTCIH
jgi:hypothetical protein